MFCSECGTRLNDNERFCHACGAAVPEGARAQAALQRVQPPVQNGPDEAAPAAQDEQPQQATAQTQPTATPQDQDVVQQAGAAPAKRRKPLLVAALAALVVIVIAAAALFARGSRDDASPVTFTAAAGTSSPAPDEAPATQPQQAADKGSWTVLAYICGSNLESQGGHATRNISELLTTELPDNVSFVLETGGANAWHNDAMDPNYLQHFVVCDGGLTLEDEQPRASMSDANTLADFVSWAAQAHPADHYMLVFWDHGGGSLSGVCQDELDYGSLTLPEIDEALTQAGVHFDVVGFDTCLMATLETAQILAPHADYLVGSEEAEPGGGWDWGGWSTWFAQGTDASPVDLGRTICDTYIAKCTSAGVDAAVTLSVVDLGQIDQAARAFAQVSEGMARATEQPAHLQRLVQDGRDVQAFGNANYIDGYTDMVDLADLMDCMADDLEDEQAVLDAVDKAVVYDRHGECKARATGLSVFYPLAIDDETFFSYFALSSWSIRRTLAACTAVTLGAYVREDQAAHVRAPASMARHMSPSCAMRQMARSGRRP